MPQCSRYKRCCRRVRKTWRQLNNDGAAVRMMAVITLVTDRLRRTESIMIMILMIDLCKCVCARARMHASKSSVGDVSPHTVSLSPVPSVLPAHTHTHTYISTNKCTRTHKHAKNGKKWTRKMSLVRKFSGRRKEINW